MNLSFKTFIEDQEPLYFTDRLKDVLNLDKNAFTNSPQWFANFQIGKNIFSGGTFTFRYVHNSKGEIVGAMIKPMNSGNVYRKSNGNMLRVNSEDNKERFISKKDLNNLLTQYAAPPPQPDLGGDPGSAIRPDDGSAPMPQGF